MNEKDLKQAKRMILTGIKKTKLESTTISFRVNVNTEGIKEVLRTLEKTNWCLRNVRVNDDIYILDQSRGKLIKVN